MSSVGCVWSGRRPAAMAWRAIFASSRFATIVGTLCLGAAIAAPPQVDLPAAKPVPELQVIPLPDDQASIRWRDQEVTRYHFGPRHRRPFLFPINGPSGRSLTRIGHPHDPHGHRHHYSVWISHNDVNGDVFWADSGPGRIVHQRVVQFADGDDQAGLVAENLWIGREDTVHLRELRGVAVRMLPNNERLILIDVFLQPSGQAATFGKTPFGLIGVRVAKTIGVHDGGGLIRNSSGQQGEQGPNGCFWQRAKWCDYSGPIATDVVEGITLLDHSSNVNHPTHFHVRDDGWMGACLSFEQPIKIDPPQALRLRYGLYLHHGAPTAEHLQQIWRQFDQMPLPAE